MNLSIRVFLIVLVLDRERELYHETDVEKLAKPIHTTSRKQSRKGTKIFTWYPNCVLEHIHAHPSFHSVWMKNEVQVISAAYNKYELILGELFSRSCFL